MEKFSKFIIEKGDLIMAKVTYHKELAEDPTDKTIRGGWFKYLHQTDMFVFFGNSHDYGPATMQMVQECIEKGNIFRGPGLFRNMADKHNWGYDTGTEIIEMKVLPKEEVKLHVFELLQDGNKHYISGKTAIHALRVYMQEIGETDMNKWFTDFDDINVVPESKWSEIEIQKEEPEDQTEDSEYESLAEFMKRNHDVACFISTTED